MTIVIGQISETVKKNYNITSVRLLIYNSYLVIPINMILAYYTGEFDRLSKFDNFSIEFFMYLIVSCLLTAVLNASFFISNEANSSLFTMLCSNCKDVFITLIAFFMLKDFDLSFKIVFGLLISTMGALLFSIKSIMENIKKVTTKDESKEKSK